MKKTLFAITIIAVAFCLVCCDAESIVKTGKNLHDMRNVNKADATGYVELALKMTTGFIDLAITEGTGSESGFKPQTGNMDEETLKALVGLVNMAKETTAPRESITSTLNKKAANVSAGQKININIKQTVEEFLSNIHDETFIANINAMVKTFSGIEVDIENKLDKVEKIITNVEPAIDAVQSIINQSLQHDGMTYGDVIARAVLFNTTKNLIILLTGTGTEGMKMNIINNLLSSLTALEVIYGVTFDAPGIAGNFVETL